MGEMIQLIQIRICADKLRQIVQLAAYDLRGIDNALIGYAGLVQRIQYFIRRSGEFERGGGFCPKFTGTADFYFKNACL